MNSFGLLSKAQKSDTSVIGRAGNVATRLGSMAAIGYSISQGESLYDYTASFAIPAVAGFAGWRTGSSIASAVTGGSIDWKANLFRGGLTVAGAASGYALGAGIGFAMTDIKDSGGVLATQLEQMTTADYNMSFEQTQGTMSHRQRAVSQLSKSKLNDRSMFLGNEASMIAGVF